MSASSSSQKTAGAIYTHFLSQLSRISSAVPRVKTPPLLNYHLYQPNLFPETPDTVLARQQDNYEIKRKSDAYHAQSPSPPSKQSNKKFLTDIPVPKVLRRHIQTPLSTLSNSTPLNKVCGFRIEVNGRRGTRANRQVMHYGKLFTKDSDRSFVDFGRSGYFNKKGASGVRVWIGYSNE
ncbi:hypothetical protein HDV05_008052 [Chytridiales sp. JEL 0842]|nr:hypothetical protein HDV05_008052 [Chytridiales sp. JEL 0842]